MSMMGCFREVPASVLSRLRDDPSLVDDIIRLPLAEAALPAGAPQLMSSAVAHMKASIAEGGDQLLPLLPPEQRDAIGALPPEKRKELFALFAEQLARSQGWDDMVTRGSQPSRIPNADLGPLVEIEKAWHGLHYLLTGSSAEAAGPLAQTVLGGIPIGEDGGYGPARFLLAEDVAAVSAALEGVSHETLRDRYDTAALEGASIYPGGWDDPENLEWLLEAFDDVRTFYRGAAARGSGALLFLT